MKLLLFITILFTLVGCSTKMKAIQYSTEYKTSVDTLWNQVKSDELDVLPQREVSYFKHSQEDEDVILKDATRTLHERSDILEPFVKLAHPNGICFRGIWQIDTPNIYSGYFKKGSEALLIARASTALSNTKSGDTRAFGFAGKLFPTLDGATINTTPSANFFLIDDLGGTDAKHYRDVALSNEPSVGVTLEVVQNMLYALKVASTFSDADRHAGIRQLYELSELGEVNSENIITPKYMKIEAADSTRVDEEDFRDELKIHKGEEILFSIFVANKIVDEKKDWQKIGSITLDASVVSESCDTRLHFHHPLWRDDLEYGFKVKLLRALESLV